jgi:hypothetical protein
MAHKPGNQNITHTVWNNYSPPPQGAAIYSINGSLTDGSVLTIKGKGFGAGATNYIYENFANFTSAGQLLQDVDNEFDTPSLFADSVADSRSGTYSINGYGLHSSDYRANISNIILGGDPTEVFSSYSIKNPVGKHMPHQGSDVVANTYPAVGSNFKPCWFLGPDSASNDIITPLLTQDRWSTDGNDLHNVAFTMGGSAPAFFTFGEWCRFTTWLKAGAVPEVDAGEMYFQGMSASGGQLEVTSQNAIFLGGTAPYKWTNVNIIGWARETTVGSTPDVANVQILLDDVYISWGDNAAVRVEIGDNANYGLCTKLSVCDPLRDANGDAVWHDRQLTVNFRASDLDLGADVFIFVTGVLNTQLVARQIL